MLAQFDFGGTQFAVTGVYNFTGKNRLVTYNLVQELEKKCFLKHYLPEPNMREYAGDDRAFAPVDERDCNIFFVLRQGTGGSRTQRTQGTTMNKS